MRKMKITAIVLAGVMMVVVSWWAGTESGALDNYLAPSTLVDVEEWPRASSPMRESQVKEAIDEEAKEINRGFSAAIVRGRILLADGSAPAVGAKVQLSGYSVGLQGDVGKVLDAYGAAVVGGAEEIKSVLRYRSAVVGPGGNFEWGGVGPGRWGVDVSFRRRGLTSMAMLNFEMVAGEHGLEEPVVDLGDILLNSMATQGADGVRIEQATEVVAGTLLVVDETGKISEETLAETLRLAEVKVLSPTGMRARSGCKPDVMGRWRIEGLSPRGDGVFQVWADAVPSPSDALEQARRFLKDRKERIAAASSRDERIRISREEPPMSDSSRPPFHPYRLMWEPSEVCVVPGEEQPHQEAVEFRMTLKAPLIHYGNVVVNLKGADGIRDDSIHGMLVTESDGTPLPVPLPTLNAGEAEFSLLALGPISEARVPVWLEVYGKNRWTRFPLIMSDGPVMEDAKSGCRVHAMQEVLWDIEEPFLWERCMNVTGRLVDDDGAPQAEVLLALGRTALQGSSDSNAPLPLSRSAVTDEDGLFCFHQVQRGLQHGISAPLGLPQGMYLEDLTGRRCRWLLLQVPVGGDEILLTQPIRLGRDEEGLD